VSRVDSVVVVVPDLPVDRLDEFADGFEASCVAEFELELRVERLLVSVLPRAGLSALRCLGSIFSQKRFIRPRDIFASLIGVEPFGCVFVRRAASLKASITSAVV